MYTPPDPPGYFDGHVWPMYLKNRIEMEDAAAGIGERSIETGLSEQLKCCWGRDIKKFWFFSVFLDGQKPKEELLSRVRDDVFKEIARLRGKFQLTIWPKSFSSKLCQIYFSW